MKTYTFTAVATIEAENEADYYYTSDIEQAGRAISENGALINSIAGALQSQGWDKDNIIKGE